MVDDSDVIKPHGQAFESLGKVRDGSSKDNKMEKGYHVTEIVGLTAKQQPVSLFSRFIPLGRRATSPPIISCLKA